MGKINEQKAKHAGLLQIIRTAQVVQKKAQHFFSPFDITDAQYNVMIVLKQAEGSLSQVQISEAVVASRANITSLIDRLEKKGYVARKRVEGDRRVFHIELTTEGADFVARVEPLYKKGVLNAMADVSLSECVTLEKTLGKVIARIAL